MRVCTKCRKLLAPHAGDCPDDGAPTEHVITLPSGVRLGAYRIERLLGEGGMGFVYEATHVTLGRRSAIKMLRPELASQQQVATRFLIEAKAVNLINHQHIVNIYDYGDGVEGGVYFVMEFLEGKTLEDLLQTRRQLSVPMLLHVFGQVARALAAAHAKKIVHRDLKPENVFVVAREDNPLFIKLLDFGVAQLRGECAIQGLTLDGAVMGTPQYMSPEQITGGAVDARSDVWAMGVMMYRAATGVTPFDGDEFGELAHRILHHPPPPAGEVVALPAALAQLIASCLERSPEQRCPSIDALIAGLDRARRECKLDDDAILAAVGAEAGPAGERSPGARRDRTRGGLAGSIPRYQDAVADSRGRRSRGAAGPRSRLGRYVAIGAAIGALGSAAYVVLGRGPGPRANEQADVPAPAREPAAGTAAPARSIEDLVAAGDPAGARALAERRLSDAITAGARRDQGFAISAIERAGVPAGAPLLHAALVGSPELIVRTARALGELGLPHSAPKLRGLLDTTAGATRVRVAIEMYRLGDRDAGSIVVAGLDDPTTRLDAAVVLAASGEAAARRVLVDVMTSHPVGHGQWLRAAGMLARLGDPAARKQLAPELARPEPERAVGAAEQLARAEDARARAQLAAMSADPGFARRGQAALALARLGDPRALDWVPAGLASRDADERRDALAICGRLAAGAKPQLPMIARLATGDPDIEVRMTAEAVVLGM